MAHIAVPGAGTGGMPAACALRARLPAHNRITLVGNSPGFHFMSSNHRVAVEWRKRGAIEFPCRPAYAPQHHVCRDRRADMGDTGMALAARPLMPPRTI